MTPVSYIDEIGQIKACVTLSYNFKQNNVFIRKQMGESTRDGRVLVQTRNSIGPRIYAWERSQETWLSESELQLLAETNRSQLRRK